MAGKRGRERGKNGEEGRKKGRIAPSFTP